MPGPDNTLGAAVSHADNDITVLDDRVDAEEHAEFIWLRAHLLPGYPHYRVVVGTDTLVLGWADRTKKFSTVMAAQQYLHNFDRNQTAMFALQTLARSLSPALVGTLSKKDVIDTVAASLVNGRAWAIELPRRAPKSRWVSKTSPSVFAPINPRYGTKVDFAYIASLEGDQWLRGYVPFYRGIVAGRSGMTVASGFDLGQWSDKELKKLGFPDALYQKLKAFIAPHNFKGLTRPEVARAVRALGPVPELDKPQADLCDGAVFSKILGDAIAGWNSSTDPGVPSFNQLPPGWQTVWLSRNYQEGPNPRNSDAINFRDLATSGKWLQAIKQLRAYKKYGLRTNQEADLLAKALPPSPAQTPAPSKPTP